MISPEMVDMIRSKYEALQAELDERGRRMSAAIEANFLGHGGVVAVTKATDLAESTTRVGRREIGRCSGGKMEQLIKRRVRKKGGGRKHLVEKGSDLPSRLDALVEPTSRGDPMSPLRWTCKSTQRLSRELTTNRTPYQPC